MPRVLILSFCALLSLPVALARAEPMHTTIEAVITSPEVFEGKKVVVEGVVEKLRYAKSLKWKPYTLFRLRDRGGNKVGVYTKGHVPMTAGASIRVTGRFRMEKQYFVYRFKNVIKAKSVEDLKLGELITFN